MRAQIQTITPEIAEGWLSRNTHNRHIRPTVTAAYARDMASGDWQLNGESIKIGSDGTLLDGQHRLLAVVESGASVEMLVVTGIENTHQETMDAGVKRQFADVLTLDGTPNSQIVAAAARAMAAWTDGNRHVAKAKSYTNAELAVVLRNNPWIINDVNRLERWRKGTRLPVGVLATMWYALSNIDYTDAEHFFNKLSSHVGFTEGDPIYALHVALEGRRERQEKPNGRTLSAIIIKAWNRYRDGQVTSTRQLQYKPGGANPEAFPEPR